MVERTSRLLSLVKLQRPKLASARECAAYLHGQAQRHCPADAPESGLRPRPRDGHAQEVSRANRRGRLLLRPAQHLAAQLQRKHQRTGAPVPAKGINLSGNSQKQLDTITDQINWPTAQKSQNTITADILSGIAPKKPTSVQSQKLYHASRSFAITPSSIENSQLAN